MGISRGKEFEGLIKEALLQVPDLSIDRLSDPTAGYSGICNISDFCAYYCPHLYYLECKAFSGSTLNFAHGITPGQWAGLAQKALITGVVAGIVVWFIDYDITAFVPIQELVKRKEAGAKSLNVKELVNNTIDSIRVPGKKKRVFFEYDGQQFINKLTNFSFAHWQVIINEGGKCSFNKAN